MFEAFVRNLGFIGLTSFLCQNFFYIFLGNFLLHSVQYDFLKTNTVSLRDLNDFLKVNTLNIQKLLGS